MMHPGARSELRNVRYEHAEAVIEAQSLLQPDELYTGLAELFGALSDATRAKIVHLLVHRELCTGDIAAALGVTDSVVSQHLRVLRSLRLVKSHRQGKFVYYRLEDAHVGLLIQVGITHYAHDDAESTVGVLPAGAAGAES